MNETTLTAAGTLITPVHLRHLADGTPVTNFRIACNERRRDRETGEWGDHDTFYASVTCWRRLAENVSASFRSGDPIIVRGRIFSRSYDKDGRRTWINEIEADVVGPDMTRCTARIARTGRSAPQASAGVPASGGDLSGDAGDVSGPHPASMSSQAEPVAAAVG
jgi:single-strand DNA-binding protein